MTLCSSHLFDLKRAKNIKERIVQSDSIPIHTAKGPMWNYGTNIKGSMTNIKNELVSL